mgnify:CR=1 FL=1
MIRAYGEKRKCYVIIEKTVSKEQALKMAAVELHEKVDNLEISSAKKDSETETEINFSVELKSGTFWCVSRKGNK